MKVIFNLPLGGLEAKIKAVDSKGKEVELQRLEIQPIFHRPTQAVSLLFGQVIDSDGDETHRFTLALSGSSAQAKMYDRGKDVIPRYESSKKKRQQRTAQSRRKPSDAPEPQLPDAP